MERSAHFASTGSSSMVTSTPTQTGKIIKAFSWIVVVYHVFIGKKKH